MSDFDNWDIDIGDQSDNSSLDDAFRSPSDNNDLGDFGVETQTADEISDSKASIFKQAVIIIIIGAILALLTFGIIRVVKGGSENNEKNNTDKTQSTVTETIQTNNVNTSNTIETNDNWSTFKADDSIYFENNFISTTFTITGIKHYVKVLEGENGLMVKSVLTGTLDGFRGTYELEVPYSKGCQLSVGKSFHVEAQVGSYGDNRVIGEIKY